MTNCPNQKNNRARCSCSYPSCPRHALCCECVAYHRSHGEIPGCFFPPDLEKSYDRSVATFLKAPR